MIINNDKNSSYRVRVFSVQIFSSVMVSHKKEVSSGCKRRYFFPQKRTTAIEKIVIKTLLLKMSKLSWKVFIYYREKWRVRPFKVASRYIYNQEISWWKTTVNVNNQVKKMCALNDSTITFRRSRNKTGYHGCLSRKKPPLKSKYNEIWLKENEDKYFHILVKRTVVRCSKNKYIWIW